jgi:REP-associated tyrosine transposase
LSHSYAQNHVHLVFSTKNRQKIIPKNCSQRLWSYTAAICKNHDILAFAVGGMDDHIHILFRLPPTITLSRVVALVKSNTSKWIKERGIRFSWQEGYGAFSVSSSNVSAVIKYIHNQEARHRKMTFEQEFIALLKKHGVEFDQRYGAGLVSHPTGLAILHSRLPRAAAPGLGSFALPGWLCGAHGNAPSKKFLTRIYLYDRLCLNDHVLDESSG